MPRFARVVVPGCPHHITHRGNRRDDVFFTDEDREEYLEILLDYTRRYGLEVWAYCLMTNHVHLIAVPVNEESLALSIGRAHMKYARHANKRQRWWGHLWANRFYSSPLDEEHCWTALKYVERNPARAGLVEVPWTYPWSSARSHVLKVSDPLLMPCHSETSIQPGEEWGVWLAGAEDEVTLAQLRTNTYTGWPTGSPEFISTLESQLGRCLTRQPAGRKMKVGGNT